MRSLCLDRVQRNGGSGPQVSQVTGPIYFTCQDTAQNNYFYNRDTSGLGVRDVRAGIITN